ncbi:stage V sporulation protein D (sporulation-specific penicillin-binding protein)/penicillin-binding protein 2B [Seinonella peptonophila]|uniref:Stage V sporulation protein D (Sporulation-specific penicillin-binding protein)/penicillin-binding protein 2B n=1 Tax=Seinonella peptonophila TaxID=112248 RepID=A0A1M4V019_9BACL|nr:penicillin-binding transpeptidase domain-containing protein [Seinonella peptonophila]SHE62259.1 stage V sporulation protein D (sporulation-specific penicillin-binding protein)/penicillin-binding protein 2B [Seinonella peptonophila]
MGSLTRKSKERTLIIGLIATLILSALILRLFWLQTVNSDELSIQAQKNWIKEQVLRPKRGSIYDRTHQYHLAWETDAFVFGAELSQVKDQKKTAQQLASLLGVSKQQILDKLNQKRSKSQKSIEFRFPGKYKYNKDVYQRFTKLKEQNDALTGIYAFPTKKRQYGGNQAAHVLGFLNTDDQPIGGIEAFYDKLLRGESGEVKFKKTKDGTMIEDDPQKFRPPIQGKDMVLTLDTRIQNQVESELSEAMKTYQAKGGTAIVADPKTGEILAMASYPTFNSNQISDTYNTAKNGHNMAVESQFEPGSTFKIVTLAAAIEEKLFHPNATFQSGSIQIEDRIIRDWKPSGWGTITFREGVELSSNVAFIKLGQLLGRDRLIQYIDKFGFGDITQRTGRKTGIDLPAEASGYYFNGQLYPTELASVSFGQGLSVTPIQQVMAVCAIANGGTLYEPHLLKEVWDQESKKKLKTIQPSGKRILNPDTTKKVRELLRDVVKQGTGIEADLPGYQVAGKTGTAQKPDPNGHGYLDNKYVVSFVGFAPADKPDVVVYIALDEPSIVGGEATGGSVAAPLASKILKKSLQVHEVDKNLLESLNVK